MADSKHTPGPWRATLMRKDTHSEHWRIGRVEAGNAIVADVTDYNDKKEERDANAKLIAAAPEMYEALEAALEKLEQAYLLKEDPSHAAMPAKGLGQIRQQAEKALKKANGGE